MGTIKQDKEVWERLLNGVAPKVNQAFGIMPDDTNARPQQNTSQINQNSSQQQTKQTAPVDNGLGTNFEIEPLFKIDYDGDRKTVRKKCGKTVRRIVNHILTDSLIENDYVKDKMEQDTETLTELYMQVEVNTIMQKAILDLVSRGNAAPRMIEVFAQLTDKIQAINKQIVNTETQLRKTYLDLKFEIKDKEAEMLDYARDENVLIDKTTQKSVGNIVTSPKQLIEQAKLKHMEKIKNVKETEFEEE